MLHQRPQRVPVRGDQHRATGPQVRQDRRLPVRQQPGDHVLQALGARRVVTEVGVARIRVLAELAAKLDFRRRRVVRAAPEHELLLAVGFEGLLLVLALQRAVVALVEPPVAADRNPVPVRDVEGDVRRGDGSPQQRGVQHIRQHLVLAQQFAAALGLGLTFLRQRYVHPAGEQVLGVPRALTMPQQHQGRSHYLRL